MSVASIAAGFPAADSEPWHELVRLVSSVLRQNQDVPSRMATVDAEVRPKPRRPRTRVAQHDTSIPSPFGTPPQGEGFEPDEHDTLDETPIEAELAESGLTEGELADADLVDADLVDANLTHGDRPTVEFGESTVEADHAEMWSLVRAAQGGDGDAFGRLYDQYVDQVYRFIYYRVNDRALAEDFTSETFLRALRRITTINYQGRDIGAWFMTIARNIVFDHSKSARFRLEMSTGEEIESDERAPSPEMMVLASLTNERLMQAVNDLNDEQKECIALRFLHGLSVAETAEVMGKNDGAIKALQHRAVKRLAALIGDELR